MKASKRVGVLRLDIDEEEGRRLVRQRGLELPPQIAVDLDHGHEHRDTKAERENDRRRQRAGTVDIGDRKPQGGHARMRQSLRHQHDGHATRRSATNVAAAEATKIAAMRLS